MQDKQGQLKSGRVNPSNLNGHLITELELLTSLLEDLNKLYQEVKDLYSQKDYSEIKQLLLSQTNKNWIEYKNIKAELDASEYLGLPEYKLVKTRSQIESTESYFDYLLKIKATLNK